MHLILKQKAFNDVENHRETVTTLFMWQEAQLTRERVDKKETFNRLKKYASAREFVLCILNSNTYNLKKEEIKYLFYKICKRG